MSPRRLILAALAATVLSAAPAAAACYADYKAKREPPLQLHYGVMEIPDSACSAGAAARVVGARLAAGGWELLQIVSVFGPDGLASRRASAGEFYLRF
jgi:uncharacterized membrane protein